ncbi:ACP phosphodiesterase [Paraglaciecola aquimarina]|uniref:ACP phosphodiesterase n=1 Tax=Paraglaciecola algarum TaxID=3050085 RepID=A0ABS9D8H6_9ALTE|nr:ACP phosphodiesterase [Paraglaciecola sp. G1-23]MCF2949235.1 ACP phosphodiesterase [Paraglaciecola sp. G1-23]
MNYIAHLHIAEHTNTSKLGNFLGDFVKGSDLTHLPEEIELGIRLHRSVDKFTDSHDLIRNLKTQFPANIRRMAGVIIDIYFDHLLMKSWQHYSAQSYHSLFSSFYTELKTFSLPDNHYYSQLSQRLLSHQWLKEYTYEPTCFRAFVSIEKRLKRKVMFATHAEFFIKQNRLLFINCFKQFYPELLRHGLHFKNNKTLSRT